MVWKMVFFAVARVIWDHQFSLILKSLTAASLSHVTGRFPFMEAHPISIPKGTYIPTIHCHNEVANPVVLAPIEVVQEIHAPESQAAAAPPKAPRQAPSWAMLASCVFLAGALVAVLVTFKVAPSLSGRNRAASAGEDGNKPPLSALMGRLPATRRQLRGLLHQPGIPVDAHGQEPELRNVSGPIERPARQPGGDPSG